MTSDRMFLPRSLVLLGAAAVIVVWASAGAAMAQEKPAPTKQDAKAQDATKAKQDAAGAKPGATQTRKIGQRPKFISTQKPAVRSKGRAALPKPTVVLKDGEVPNIKFDTPVYDFGRVRAGQPVKHDFWFTNTGTGPLEILRVKPS